MDSIYSKFLREDWHTLLTADTLKELDTSRSGLSSDEAQKRLAEFGPNELEAEAKVSPWLLLLGQFKSLLIIILVIAAAISWGMGDFVEAIAIIIIVLLAGVLGFVQEFQAGKAIESLRKMASPHAHVLRNGEEININAADLVPGDIVILKTGDKIPADGRLVESLNLRIEEASLTGESVPVEKSIEKIDDLISPLGDRKNMVFMGTAISYGRGKAVVTATGMRTEFGKIAGMLQSTENRKTPLQENLDELGKKIGLFAIVLASVMSVIGWLRGETLVKMFTWGVALAVAVIPEALPAVVTISLALGVRRMVKRRALIRKLPAVETLGATNVICSDKTGTLTQDEMTIRNLYSYNKLVDVTGVGYNPAGEFLLSGGKINPLEHHDLNRLLHVSAQCNDTILKKIGDSWDIIGDPTEGAMVTAAAKAGLDIDFIRNQNPRIDEIPFSSETKRMTTIHKLRHNLESYSKGAVEVILDSCTTYLEGENVKELTAEVRENFINVANELSKKALRVLAFSVHHFESSKFSMENAEKEMTFIGLVGMFDPPRPEVKVAIERCFSAGIRPIMITGDHKVTAVAVAKELGILQKGGALSGVELEQLTDAEFEKSVETTDVYARISPSHKLKIVSALMKKGNIVAMTGDGVNDAPSLKKADIGVAMGITGTDVSKEAADMILTDDNFASIVNAVEEGRSIFENIRKYLVFLLSGNMGTVFALIYTLIAGLIIPLSAVQILFINFIMDGLMAIALGVEPPEPGIMNKKPRNVKEGILNRDTIFYIGFVGVIIAAVTVTAYVWALSEGYEQKEASTVFFLTLIFARLFNGLNCRSLDQSIFKMPLFSNKSLLYASFVSLGMSLAVVFIGFLQKAFHTTTIAAAEWVGLLVSAVFVLVIVEIWKIFRRKKI
ncbi:MAG: calcium-transporting P-type ATPase, PMR1-type [Ignavibacteriaceae bacterium]|nr:calcium-transporting P-type ATPase, PMR1-type [Ignavibacteriaceae bacterium]